MTESIEQAPVLNWEKLRNQAEIFGDKVSTALETLGILKECKQLRVDHACIRLADSDNVDTLHEELQAHSNTLSTTAVNGRDISILQLHEPLKVGFWETSGIELPYPKAGHGYSDGWEHVEFVIGGPGETLEDIRQAFFERFAGLDIETLRDEFEYKEDMPDADANQFPNPTISLKVNGVGLKFHARPIQEIVGA